MRSKYSAVNLAIEAGRVRAIEARGLKTCGRYDGTLSGCSLLVAPGSVCRRCELNRYTRVNGLRRAELSVRLRDRRRAGDFSRRERAAKLRTPVRADKAFTAGLGIIGSALGIIRRLGRGGQRGA